MQAYTHTKAAAHAHHRAQSDIYRKSTNTIPPDGNRRAYRTYFRSIARYALLTPEEEHTLTREYAVTRCEKLKNRLVNANLRLVVRIALGYHQSEGKPMMDLIQEGNVGLLKAIERYDPGRDVKISTYAAWWIRAFILRYIMESARLVKIGTTQDHRKIFFNYHKEYKRLAQRGIDPTKEMLAEKIGVSVEDIEIMAPRMLSNDSSLNAPILFDQRDSGLTAQDMLPSFSAPADDVLGTLQFKHLLRENLRSFQQSLDGKEAAIFKQRLLAEEPVTLQDLGAQFGVSRERIRQLEKRLVDRLRAYLSIEMGSEIRASGKSTEMPGVGFKSFMRART